MKHISKSKIGNCFVLGAPLEVELLKKCTLLCREARFDNTAETPHVRTTLHVEASFCVAGAMGSAPCQKCTTAFLVAGHPGHGPATATPRPRHGHPATRPHGHPATATRPRGHTATRPHNSFVAVAKTVAGVGCLKGICQKNCLAGAVQETSSSEMLGGQGADFLSGCILEHQIIRFACLDDFAGQVQHFV